MVERAPEKREVTGSTPVPTTRTPAIRRKKLGPDADFFRLIGDGQGEPGGKHLADRGSTAAVAANEEVVPASALRAAEQRIRELERALGKKTMEVEILQAARDEVKKKPRWYGASKR